MKTAAFLALTFASACQISSPLHAQVVTEWQPVRTYYAPARTTAYYAPTTTYYAPVETTAYYAPTTTYYAPAATTAYYAPAATTAYYGPTTTYYVAPTYHRPLLFPFSWRLRGSAVTPY